MKDVANELGVSVALVSYVLNGKKTDKINAQTAAKIRSTALKMKYSPNQIAKSLKTSKTHTLGLIVADISNLFYSSIAKYIEEEANLHGYHIIYGSAYEEPQRFNSILHLLLSRQVDGLILAIPEKAEDCIQQLTDMEQPFVILDRKFYNYPKAPAILLDNFHASTTIVQHLIDNGYKRLGVVTINRGLINLQERKTGFEKTVFELLKQQPFIYEVEEDDMENQMQTLIPRAISEDKVDCLCFFTNKVAMAALAKVAAMEIKVPDQLGIVCFDEAESYNLFRTPVTYFRQPLKEMSHAAIANLVAQMESKGAANSTVQVTSTMPIEFKGTLVVRESSVRNAKIPRAPDIE